MHENNAYINTLLKHMRIMLILTLLKRMRILHFIKTHEKNAYILAFY